MSTRGTVAIKNEDGSVTSIYSHWDNYIEGTGAVLVKKYTTVAAVKELIMLGDCSFIEEDRVEAYHRDRKEDWEGVQPQTWENYEEMLKDNYQEYNYLFDNNKWYVVDYYEDSKKMLLVTEVLGIDNQKILRKKKKVKNRKAILLRV